MKRFVFLAACSLLTACGSGGESGSGAAGGSGGAGAGAGGGGGHVDSCVMTLSGDLEETIPCGQAVTAVAGSTTVQGIVANDQLPAGIFFATSTCGFIGDPVPGSKPQCGASSSAMVGVDGSCYAAIGSEGTQELEVIRYDPSGGTYALRGIYLATLVHVQSCVSDVVLPGSLMMRVDFYDGQ